MEVTNSGFLIGQSDISSFKYNIYIWWTADIRGCGDRYLIGEPDNDIMPSVLYVFV